MRRGEHFCGIALARERRATVRRIVSAQTLRDLDLMDACSLGRAAELAGVTRWDIQDRLKEQGIPIPAPGDQSAQERDDLAKQLEREGVL